MIKFAQALDQTDRSARHILLGNGFSQSWNHETFNYKYLFEKANFGVRDAVIKSIFQKFETYDFETVMFKMLASADVLESYRGDPTLIEQIRTDTEILKESLIQVITDCHPTLPSRVSDEEYEMARHFLYEFKKIFTLNYDLLMYWARNKSDIEPEAFKTDDGFRWPETWSAYREDVHQQVFFLHGALHLYDNGVSIKKHAYDEDAEVSIVSQVRMNLRNNKFPLFVSEPTHFKKSEKIKHNPYLDYCFRQLKQLNGDMFIFGHSFDESDKHIFDELKNSSVNRFYVSIYGNENSEHNLRTIANARTFLAPKDVVFFSAESTPIWRVA
ncbi:DUF4917 family protein [Vibrio cholerae]|uniref:DUF4917 family protein n=1 Tax=Vibrio cholerae TaxID=666 RepID=UPI00155F3587|nr:DUF4917 family protein [Vibrio cholerae]ELJ8527736.1 DUF4917 family protein [Vibrio cholerae]NOE62995.1 DUF4917 family protein [Vibrio cholerae]